ncbi:MAG: hypothetical protein ACREOB_12600 [Thermodesulfobacteriota bacterium]
MKWNQVKTGDIIKVAGEKIKVTKVTRTADGEVRVSTENKGSHYQEIHDPNEQVK